MTKRIVSYALICVIVISVFQCAATAQTQFPDLSGDHWAYAAVNALVSDGTVKGFEDGTFRPNDTVSRAEFVKMIGKGADKRSGDFADVSTSHWGYDYIMYSGLEGSGGNFNPDVPITRNDVLNLVWTRNGSKTGVLAPSVITAQGSSADAVAWAYTYGIMVGNDGVNLRLSDSLSRAEAAVLIIRARDVGANAATRDFIDTVSPKVLETVYSSVRLFDDAAYTPDKTITYGELSRAALRLGTEAFELTYDGLSKTAPFKHAYAVDFNIVAKDVFGEDKITAENIDKPATVKDTLAALTYNMIRKSASPVKYGQTGAYYKDITAIGTKMSDICLTYSFGSGVQLYADGSIKPDKTVTMKEFVALLLQLDHLIGSQTEYTTDYTGRLRVAKNSKISKNTDAYPANSADFQCILEGVPNAVYTTPFVNNVNGSNPKSTYDFTREYREMFVNFMDEFKVKLTGNTGLKIRITYYPTLVIENGNDATIRAKFEILENPGQTPLSSLLKDSLDVSDVSSIDAAKVFYGDIVVGQKFKDIYIPSDLAKIKQIVYVLS